MAWSDAARAAALEVRRRNAKIRFGGFAGYTNPYTGKVKPPSAAEARRVRYDPFGRSSSAKAALAKRTAMVKRNANQSRWTPPGRAQAKAINRFIRQNRSRNRIYGAAPILVRGKKTH